MGYKIKRNKSQISDEKINSHKDFKKLVADYNQVYQYRKAVSPLYKDKKFLGFIILMAIIFMTIWLSGQETEDSTQKPKSSKDIKVE